MLTDAETDELLRFLEPYTFEIRNLNLRAAHEYSSKWRIQENDGIAEGFDRIAETIAQAGASQPVIDKIRSRAEFHRQWLQKQSDRPVWHWWRIFQRDRKTDGR